VDYFRVLDVIYKRNNQNPNTLKLKEITLNIRIFSGVMLSLLFSLILIAGCSSCGATTRYADNPVAGRDTLAQISTIDSLMAGVYDGTITCGNIKEYGDFGVGTFDKLDGEMVVLDGGVFQVKSDGVVYKVEDALTSPFAAVTYFDADLKPQISAGLKMADVQKLIDSSVPTENIFYAIKIDGTFSYMKTRSVPAQQKPYPVLTEVTAKQAVFEFQNISGTIVGFRCPPYVNGVNVPGYHLHFLTADKKAGGHILDFTVQEAKLTIDETPNFLMLLPGEGSDFYKLDLSGNKATDIQKAEK
jgi:acetolactate decarboxylase